MILKYFLCIFCISAEVALNNRIVSVTLESNLNDRMNSIASVPAQSNSMVSRITEPALSDMMDPKIVVPSIDNRATSLIVVPSLDNRISSGTLKNDKYYVFSPAQSGENASSIIIYQLKDGPTSEIQSTRVNITDVPSGYMPQILDLNTNLENGASNDIWMIEGYLYSKLNTTNSDKSKWMAEISDDKQLNFNSDFIKPPNFTYFPKGGYTQNFVNINNNPALYVIGGFTFLKDKGLRVLTSCVFKYDFNSNNWSDLSEDSKSILPPIAVHKTIKTNNALFVFNGITPNISDTSYPQTSEKILSSKINTINKTYRLDLLTGKWSEIPIKTNLDPEIYIENIMPDASFDYYKGKIISYGQMNSKNGINFDPKLGILDLNSYEWHWNQLKTESGLDNILKLNHHQTLIIRDQLILFPGNYTIFSSVQLLTNYLVNEYQKSSYGPYILDLNDLTFKSNLNYSGRVNASDGLPVYIKAIIGIGAVLSFILLVALIRFYIRHRKWKTGARNNKHEINALWVPQVDGKQKYISERGIVNINQTNDQIDHIFTLEIADNNRSEIRKSFMPDQLNSLKLAR
jgi:hypothetical protein